MHIDLPEIEYLNECFDLDIDTGLLTWKERPEHHFKTKLMHRQWNSKYKGKSACVNGGIGYYLVCINRKRYKSHRIVYKMFYGVDPGHLQIDHINNVRSDNRPSNLRLATQSQNTVNFKGARKDSTHGFRGISWKEKNNKWQVSLCVMGKMKYVGLFASVEDALNASNKARKEAFGEFFEEQKCQ